MNMERSTGIMYAPVRNNKVRIDGLFLIAQAYLLPGSQLPEALTELPNLTKHT